MEKTKMISTRELVGQIKALRKKTISTEFAEQFNRITENDLQDIEQPLEIEKKDKKIARTPEASI
jgi:hypothetical protein